MGQAQEAQRVDISSIEKDLARGSNRYARRRMRVVVIPKQQAMPGGYMCEQGESVILVPENEVKSVMAMAATDEDRLALEFAKKRFAEEMAKARAEGIPEDMVGFSVQSLFRDVSGHDYPALEAAEVIDGGEALPPEQLLSEQRAQEASARLMAGIVKEAIFAKPDDN